MKIVRHHFECVESTNLYGKQHAKQWPSDQITLITASSQTAGYGRFNRRWVSPQGQNIYASFCFFLDSSRTDKGNIPQVLALSAAHVFAKLHFHPQLKWPNDILLSKKKIGGILAETVALDKDCCFILGIGLNVNMNAEDLQRIGRPATSLLAEGGRPYDVESILLALQQEFQNNLLIFLEKGFAPFLDEYRNKILSGAHEIIRFSHSQNIWEGKIHSVSDDGSLYLQLPNGDIKVFSSGEIFP
jgi:BirA family transcriptional regulator, biotin operon repressor / biotin---[acetyl-CoA-carboxylase] ligase